MTNLSAHEKLRILEVRATRDADGRLKSWERVAEETYHSKNTVINVNKWFQSLPWADAKSFPELVQRLREDYLDQLLRNAIASEPIQVVVSDCGPVPDIPTWYENPLGRIPSFVGITETNLGTKGKVYLGSVNSSSIQLESQSNCSGVVASIKFEFDPRARLLSGGHPGIVIEPAGPNQPLQMEVVEFVR